MGISGLGASGVKRLARIVRKRETSHEQGMNASTGIIASQCLQNPKPNTVINFLVTLLRSVSSRP